MIGVIANRKKAAMRLLICAMTLLFSFISFGQTLKETQDWIKEKIELYPQSNLTDDSKAIYEYEYTVNFDESNMIISSQVTYYTVLDINPKEEMIIPLKNLMGITFTEKETMNWLNFRIRGNSKDITIKKLPYISKGRIIRDEEIEYVSNSQIFLNTSINDDNLKPRLVKAFTHLVKLYGGKVVKEKF